MKIRVGRGASRREQAFLYLPHPRYYAGKVGSTTPILQMRQQIQSQQCSQDYTAGGAGFEPRIPTTTHMLSFHFPSSLLRKPGFLIKPHGLENASEGNAHLPGLEVLLLQAPASPMEAVIHQVLLHDTVLRVKEHVAGSTSGGLAYIIHCRQRGARNSPGTFPPSGMTPTSLTPISPFSPVPLSPQAPPKISVSISTHPLMMKPRICWALIVCQALYNSFKTHYYCYPHFTDKEFEAQRD